MTNKGFLLFEVMVATVVLAVGITTTLGVFNGAISSVKKLQDRTLAIFLAQQKICDIKTEGIDNVPLSGGFEDGFERFNYRLTREQVEGLPLEKVTVYVAASGGASTRAFSVATYIGRGK